MQDGRYRADVVLTGPSCAGKSTLATKLMKAGWHVVTARTVIVRADPQGQSNREALQRRGAQLEQERPGRWLMEAAIEASRPVVVDAARTTAQVAAARELLPGCLVVHVRADESVRRSRFVGRADPSDLGVEFDTLRVSPIEREAESLAHMADLVLDGRASRRALLESVLQAADRRCPGDD